MTYSHGLADVVPPMVSVYTFGWSPIADERTIGSAPSSAAWESANRAFHFPILVPVLCVVRRLWWANGATVSASYNLDCGIYADGGYKPATKLISTGSTAQGTASQVQFVDVTDTVLCPGLYWIALACSSASPATIMQYAGAASSDAAIRFQESSSLPLPATATPVESTGTPIYLFGFATTASP